MIQKYMKNQGKKIEVLQLANNQLFEQNQFLTGESTSELDTCVYLVTPKPIFISKYLRPNWSKSKAEIERNTVPES